MTAPAWRRSPHHAVQPRDRGAQQRRRLRRGSKRPSFSTPSMSRKMIAMAASNGGALGSGPAERTIRRGPGAWTCSRCKTRRRWRDIFAAMWKDRRSIAVARPLSSDRRCESLACGRPGAGPGPGDDVGAADLARRVATNLRDSASARAVPGRAGVGLRVSRAALSQIETLKSNPSLSVLWKIAVGLRIPFSELLGDPDRRRTCCAGPRPRSCARPTDGWRAAR